MASSLLSAKYYTYTTIALDIVQFASHIFTFSLYFTNIITIIESRLMIAALIKLQNVSSNAPTILVKIIYEYPNTSMSNCMFILNSLVYSTLCRTFI